MFVTFSQCYLFQCFSVTLLRSVSSVFKIKIDWLIDWSADAYKAVYQNLLSNWRRWLGRPRQSWLATIHPDRQQLDIHLDKVPKLASDRLLRRGLICDTMHHSGACYWWWWTDDDQDRCEWVMNVSWLTRVVQDKVQGDVKWLQW